VALPPLTLAGLPWSTYESPVAVSVELPGLEQKSVAAVIWFPPSFVLPVKLPFTGLWDRATVADAAAARVAARAARRNTRRRRTVTKPLPRPVRFLSAARRRG